LLCFTVLSAAAWLGSAGVVNDQVILLYL